MHLHQFCLLVTLAFVACCTTFASAEDLVHDKSLKTNSQRKLTDGSRRNLKGSIDEVADEERGTPSFVSSIEKVSTANDQTLLEKVADNLKAFFGRQKKPQSWFKKVWEKFLGLPKKIQSWFKKMWAKSQPLQSETKLAKGQPMLDYQKTPQSRDETELAKVQPMLDYPKTPQSRDETELAKLLDDPTEIESLDTTELAKGLDSSNKQIKNRKAQSDALLDEQIVLQRRDKTTLKRTQNLISQKPMTEAEKPMTEAEKPETEYYENLRENILIKHLVNMEENTAKYNELLVNRKAGLRKIKSNQ